MYGHKTEGCYEGLVLSTADREEKLREGRTLRAVSYTHLWVLGDTATRVCFWVCACQSAEADNVTRMQIGKHSQAHSHPFGVAIDITHSEKGILAQKIADVGR